MLQWFPKHIHNLCCSHSENESMKAAQVNRILNMAAHYSAASISYDCDNKMWQNVCVCVCLGGNKI